MWISLHFFAEMAVLPTTHAKPPQRERTEAQGYFADTLRSGRKDSRNPIKQGLCTTLDVDTNLVRSAREYLRLSPGSPRSHRGETLEKAVGTPVTSATVTGLDEKDDGDLGW